MHRRKCTSQLRTGAAPAPACGVALVTPHPINSPCASVEGLFARLSPGLCWPRVTLTGRLRGDKAPDVLVEALALLHAPPPTAAWAGGGRCKPLGPAVGGFLSCGRSAPTAPPPGMTCLPNRRALLAGYRPSQGTRQASCARAAGAWRWRLVGVMMKTQGRRYSSVGSRAAAVPGPVSPP